MSVRRFKPFTTIYKAKEGDYVLYEDYEKLKKRLDECHDKLSNLYFGLFPEERVR